MGDIGIAKNWLVSPTKEIDEMWIKVAIQEKKSMIARYKQDIEDLMHGRVTDLQAKIKMNELEMRELETKLLKSKSISA